MAPEQPVLNKRARLAANRQIRPAQRTSLRKSIGPALGKANESALKNGPELPANVAVERFTLARAAEITSMKDSMRNTFLSATKRAFQTLPRHLRRRAASHNARRVPGRLRAKAAAEIDPKTRTIPKHYPRKKIAKKIGLTKTERFRRRQRSKIWLETHIWHAKRMHMINVWGFRLAHHPTEKSFRPSHRAASHGSILNDVSYFSLVELKATEHVLERILKTVAGEICWGKRYSSGSRQAQTTLYRPASYPLNLLCPATVLWQPLSPTTTQPSSAEPEAGPSSQIIRHSKQTEEPIRKVWIRFHACSHAEVWGALRGAITHVLDEITLDQPGLDEKEKRKSASSATAGEGSVVTAKETTVELNDIRDSVNVFEIIGPKSGKVLKGALGALTKSEDRNEMRQIWKRLPDLRTAGNMPSGMVMGFTVYDPRLSFPPKNVKHVDPSNTDPLAPAFPFQPSSELARSDLWDSKVRARLGRKKTKKVELDKRRAKLGIPGQPLRAIAQDARIPVLLIQHSIPTPNPANSMVSKSSMHGYILYLPKAWAQPFLHSLVFTGTRIGGIRERQSQAYETGSGSFPSDWPGTDASARWWAEREKEDTHRWEKKPSAKRTNWNRLGWKEGGNPWKPDWSSLFSSIDPTAMMTRDIVLNDGSNGRNSQETIAADTTNQPKHPWLLRTPSPTEILYRISNPTASSVTPPLALLAELNAHRSKRGLLPLKDSQANELYSSALIRVSVAMLGRGVAQDVGPIYKLATDPVAIEEEAGWRDGFARGKRGRDLDWDEQSQIPIPPFSDTIGYQTTGAFSLSRGKGHGLGAIPLSAAVDLVRRDVERTRIQLVVGRRPTRKSGELINLVKVRARDSNVVRPAVLDWLD